MNEVILIVDDSHVVRALYAYTLQDKGYQTLEADNGISALETLQKSPVSLAIVELRLYLKFGPIHKQRICQSSLFLQMTMSIMLNEEKAPVPICS